MFAAVTGINRQIRQLAPVLNSPTLKDGAVTSDRSDVPIHLMAKRYDSATYLFAVGMRNAPAKGSFSVSRLPGAATAEVIGEGRRLPVRGGRFQDHFAPYEVHLYRIH